VGQPTAHSAIPGVESGVESSRRRQNHNAESEAVPSLSANRTPRPRASHALREDAGEIFNSWKMTLLYFV
jgi:hypothetical protein